jgi:hypothetical protein
MAETSPGTIVVAESAPGSSAAPDRMPRKDLAGSDNRDLLDIVRFSPRASKRQAAACALWLRRFHLAPP